MALDQLGKTKQYFFRGQRHLWYPRSKIRFKNDGIYIISQCQFIKNLQKNFNQYINIGDPEKNKKKLEKKIRKNNKVPQIIDGI